MKSFGTELKKYAEKTRLKASERAELRARILTYMEYHPLTNKAVPQGKTISYSFSIFQQFGTRIAASAFAILFIVVGVPIAAERAVPGDILYPVKTKINEEVRAQFINSPYERIAFETELMERRIAEARLLEKEGKLSEEIEAQLAETVRGHATAAWAGIAELNATDSEEGAIAKITFGTALDVQSALIKGEGNGEDGKGIALAVSSARASVAADSSTTTPSYARLSARVEQHTTRAYELLSSIESSATVAERTNIERRLADIERKIIAAQVAHEEENGEDVKLLSGVLGDIQKLISFMTDIDVRANVSIEDLVPVVLTPEERLESLEQKLNEHEVDSEEGGSASTTAAVEVELGLELSDGATETEDVASSTEEVVMVEIEDSFVKTLRSYIEKAKTLLTEGRVKESENVIGEAETFVAQPTEDSSDDTKDAEEVVEEEIPEEKEAN